MWTAWVSQVGQEVEVSAKARRRRFSAEYKRAILKEADGLLSPIREV